MVSAWPRLKLPPSVWQSLWWIAIDTPLSAVPASQAPYWARASAVWRGSPFTAGSTTAGRLAASARMPSSAIIDTIGFASTAYSASTQCATAFMPDGPAIFAGSVSSIAGS